MVLAIRTQMIQAMGVTVGRWRRPVLNGLLTVGPPLMLLAFLVAIDDRVREQLTLRVAPAHAAQALVAAGSTARSLASVLIEAGRDQTLAHAPLLIFAMAATMLTIFMVRT
jgi:chromate transport protein ChrA